VPGNPPKTAVSLSNEVSAAARTPLPPAEIKLDYNSIKSGAGMRFLDDRLIVRVTGDDRFPFMHGMCTADVKRLAPGMAAPALFVTEHAHVLADCFLYSLDQQALWLELERSRWPVVRLHLEKLLVADDVEFEELASLLVFDLEGPRALEIVNAIFPSAAIPTDSWRHIESHHYRTANLPRYVGPAFSIIAGRAALLKLAEQVKHRYPEVRDLSAESLEIVRIENGLAKIGVDTNQRTLALEARLERAISFNKGCYVGQETIERATARGALKRRLCGLRINGDRLPAAGASITLGDKEVGRLTSVTCSPDAGIIGLAILHHSAWPAGTHVCISDGLHAFDSSVCDLPFGL